MTLLAALCGALVAGGVWLVATSWRPVPVRAARRTRRGTLDAAVGRRVGVASGSVLLVLVVTRWPVAALMAGAAGWAVAGRPRRVVRQRVEARTEAIALWAQMLRDGLGTGRGVEGVLVATADVAPLPIRPEVVSAAARLRPSGNGDRRSSLDDVLDQLVRDLAHPLGDLVVMALRISATQGGARVREVLADVATAAYAEAEAARRVEVARARPRAAMRYTAMIIGGFVAMTLVVTRDFLAPYGTPIGQLVLLLVAVYWVSGYWWMYRMSRPDPIPRFLAVRNDP